MELLKVAATGSTASSHRGVSKQSVSGSALLDRYMAADRKV